MELVAGMEVFGLPRGPVLDVVGWSEGGGETNFCGNHEESISRLEASLLLGTCAAEAS